jgi:hypothetical protein
LAQYLELLAEDFVGENEASRLAQQIYRRHRKAIDFIAENIQDPILAVSGLVEEFLKANADNLEIRMGPCNKGWIRFVPRRWDVARNRNGSGWGPDSPVILCEICLWAKTVELQVTAGRAPDAWADLLWKRAERAPFKQEWK